MKQTTSNQNIFNLLKREDFLINDRVELEQTNNIIEKPNLVYLIDRFADVALKYERVSLVFANALGISIVIFVVTKLALQMLKEQSKRG